MAQNVEEVPPGKILDVSTLTMDIIKVVRETILVVSKGRIEPVYHVDQVVFGHLQNNQISHKFESGGPPEGIDIDFFDLFDYYFGHNRSLKKPNNRGDTKVPNL